MNITVKWIYLAFARWPRLYINSNEVYWMRFSRNFDSRRFVADTILATFIRKYAIV